MLNSQPTNIIKTKDRFDKSLGDNMYNTLKFKKKEEKKEYVFISISIPIPIPISISLLNYKEYFSLLFLICIFSFFL